MEASLASIVTAVTWVSVVVQVRSQELLHATGVAKKKGGGMKWEKNCKPGAQMLQMGTEYRIRLFQFQMRSCNSRRKAHLTTRGQCCTRPVPSSAGSLLMPISSQAQGPLSPPQLRTPLSWLPILPIILSWAEVQGIQGSGRGVTSRGVGESEAGVHSG